MILLMFAVKALVVLGPDAGEEAVEEAAAVP